MKENILLSIFHLLLIVSVSRSDTSIVSAITSAPTTSTPTSTRASITSPPTTSTSTTEYAAPSSTCNLKKSSLKEKALLEELTKLKNSQFTWEDNDHKYYFGVCTKADTSNTVNEGFLQINKKTNKKFVLGRLDDVDLEGGKTWIRLTYKQGDKYANACNRAERNAVVYILCNPDNSTEIFEMIEENNEREDACAYVFQLLTPAMCVNTSTKCPSTDSTNSKSKWGLFSMIFFSILGTLFIYLLIGTIYLRFVRQARGIEQIPHWTLWQAIGMKSADCCNYVCRCGQKTSEVRQYEHINDRLSDDENLLNM